VVTALVLGAILLAGMLVTAGYAMKTLPRDAQVPVNAGVPEASLWLSRLAGLGAWLGAGVAGYVIGGAITVSGVGANWFPSVRMSLLPAVIFILLAGEVGAVISAGQRAGVTALLTPVVVPESPVAAEADAEQADAGPEQTVPEAPAANAVYELPDYRRIW
jgi:hypothetical protein